jgi:hypothetical protein
MAKELAAHQEFTDKYVEEIVGQIIDDPDNLFSLTIARLRHPEALWSTVIKPLLGLLLVTQEPLLREHLKYLLNLAAKTNIDGDRLNQGLERLGGLVVTDERQRYSLFHLKFRDYLCQDRQRPQKAYVFDLQDEQYWHQHFVIWCERDDLSQIWNVGKSQGIEQERCSYVRQHYIIHLYKAGDWNKLFQVLDGGAYGKAKVQFDPSMRSYVLDLDLGREAAASSQWMQREAIYHLSYLWRYTLLRCSLASRADTYSKRAFELLLLLGQISHALGLAEPTGCATRLFS